MTPVLVHTTERGKHRYRVYLGFVMDGVIGQKAPIMVMDGAGFRFISLDHIASRCTPHYYVLLSEAKLLIDDVRRQEDRLKLWPGRLEDIEAIRKSVQFGAAS